MVERVVSPEMIHVANEIQMIHIHTVYIPTLYTVQNMEPIQIIICRQLICVMLIHVPPVARHAVCHLIVCYRFSDSSVTYQCLTKFP